MRNALYDVTNTELCCACCAMHTAVAVRHMVAVGEQLLQQEDQKQPGLQPAVHKFGFHKPPFRSVDHLQ